MQKSKYELLSDERKETTALGLNPEWLTTPGYQLLKGAYLTEEDSDLKKTFTRISKLAAKYSYDPAKYEPIFYDLMWSGSLSLATPILANMGTDKAMVVSCTGNVCPDSVKGFYDTTMESAVLSQEGFGTSSYLGDIRPRGSKISRGGTASGVLPVIKQFVQMARDITQGTRRGAWAGYLEITHDDFWEVVNHLQHNPQDLNIGWIIPDSFIEDLKADDEEALKRYKRALYVKLLTGKGYFAFIDRANRHAPKAMQDQGLVIKASQLCNEVFLFSDANHSYGCLLSSVNIALRDSWKEDTIFNSMILLDCVCEYFLEQSANVEGLEKVHKYMLKSRSVGLGILGFHTYLQKNGIPIASIDAVYKNGEIAKELDEESLRASEYLAEKLGEPEWCKGYGIRFLNRMAIAPNTSSAVIAGSVSPGIEPIYANAFVQPISGGEVNRVNSVLIPIMKREGVYSDATILDILANEGSVQHVEWLSDEEKQVFLTAFEIDQSVLVRLASQRQKRLDQGQSLNLFFSAGTQEEYISEIHQMIFLDEYILGAYYIRSNNSNKASSGECVACTN